MGKLLLEYTVYGNVKCSSRVDNNIKVNELRSECLKLAGIEGVVDIAINDSMDIFDYVYVVFDDNYIVRSIDNLVKTEKDLNSVDVDEILDGLVQIKFDLMFYDCWIHNNYLVILDFEQAHDKQFNVVDIKILVSTLTNCRNISFATWSFDIFACYILWKGDNKFNLLEFSYDKINLYSGTELTYPDSEQSKTETDDIEKLLLLADKSVYVHVYLNVKLREKLNLTLDDDKELIIKNQQKLWNDADEFAIQETNAFISRVNELLK